MYTRIWKGEEENTTREGIYILKLVSNFVAEGVEKHTVPLSDMGHSCHLENETDLPPVNPHHLFLHALSSPTLHRFLCSFLLSFYSMIPVSPPLTHTLFLC